MNTIAAHLRDEPDVAEEMLERLSTLLRMVLRGAGEHEVPLARELDLVGHYLGIHEVRFGGRLVVHYDVEPALEGALVPHMVLQPIVENAVAHGVAARPGPARISVTAAANGPTLLLSVRDDGSAGAHPPPPGTGIGLPNTRARLAQLYGSRARLTVAPHDGGTRVDVALPLHFAAPAEPQPREAGV